MRQHVRNVLIPTAEHHFSRPVQICVQIYYSVSTVYNKINIMRVTFDDPNLQIVSKAGSSTKQS